MSPDNRDVAALVGELGVLKRRYDGLRSARQRLLLQALATCRAYAGGDKEAGAKLYKEPPPELEAWLAPYMAAIEPLETAIKDQEKLLTGLGRRLPVADWAAGIDGLSPRFLAMLVGEAGTGPGEFRTVAGLWKRFGLAVLDGARQRRITGDAALEHGYCARRRALMWNVGESMIRRQISKGAAIGDYGRLYQERKVYEATKTDRPIVAHSRAKRYIEKRLLRELWKAWRAAVPNPDRSAGVTPPPESVAPADPDATRPAADIYAEPGRETPPAGPEAREAAE